MSQEEILQATYLTESNIKEYETPKAKQLKKNKESHQKTGKWHSTTEDLQMANKHVKRC